MSELGTNKVFSGASRNELELFYMMLIGRCHQKLCFEPPLLHIMLYTPSNDTCLFVESKTANIGLSSHVQELINSTYKKYS